MKRNVGNAERFVRAAGGSALLLCSAVAPVPWWARVFLMAGMGGYLLVSALAGTCLGYTLLGKSTCPTRPGERAA